MTSNLIICEDVHAQLDEGLGFLSAISFESLAHRILANVVSDCAPAYRGSRSPIDRTYMVPLECQNLLAENELIFNILRRCHESGKYAEIRERPEFHIPPTPSSKPSNLTPLNTTRPGHKTNEATIKNSIRNFVEKLKPEIKKFLDEPDLATWQATEISDEKTRQFFQGLAIPNVNDKPNLLLHNIGIENPAVKGLFAVKSKHRILCNTSGAGKTRLIFDGLCHHWGFYFVAAQDSSAIGHKDLEATIGSLQHYPTWVGDLFAEGVDRKRSHQSNENLAFKQFYKVLLARWIIFKTFIDVAREQHNGDLPKNIKRSWLLFQIFPLGGVDNQPPFTNLMDHCLRGADAPFLQEQLIDFNPCKILGTAFNPSKENFFYVLDEAQVAGRQHLGAFTDDEGETPRPVLRPLILSWSGVMSDPSTRFIVSGTGFSLDLFHTVLTSGAVKESGLAAWDVIHETGDFTVQEVQKAYISHYLPESFLSSLSGRALLARAYEWLRGRHRFTTRFIELLLIQEQWAVDRPGSPHKLLNAFVHKFTDFHPLDGDAKLLAEESDVLRPLDMNVLLWDKLSSQLKAELSNCLNRYITRGEYPLWKSDYEDLVELGVARFVQEGVTVTEPLVLVSMMQYFEKEKFGLEQENRRDMQTDKGLAFEEAVLVPCTKIFRNGTTLENQK